MDPGLNFAAVLVSGVVISFFTVSILEMRKKGLERRELEARERAAAGSLLGEPARPAPPRDPRHASPVPAPRSPT